MRPVNKDIAPRVYNNYSDARHDLAKQIGYYCSYCEMKVYQSIEVEHILPQNKNGEVLDWDNFLLSCKYCNTIKSDHNDNLDDYFWPDRDNSDLVFEYNEINVITPKNYLNSNLISKANNTINLMGLNRGPDVATQSDTRWRSREEVWSIAKQQLINWQKAKIPPMSKSIASSALLSGHYSIWIEVFKDEQEVLDEIDRVYYTKGLFKQYSLNKTRYKRPLGLV